MTRAFLGLGSNLGQREEWLRQAALRLGPHLLALSRVYESDPVGPVQDQPPFLNAVALLSWPGDAWALLARCLDIERELGRERVLPQGPRTIDLDLLLFGTQEIRAQGLTVPHPRLLERAFAVVPLLELDPEVTLPDGRRLSDVGSWPRAELRPWPMRWEVGS